MMSQITRHLELRAGGLCHLLLSRQFYLYFDKLQIFWHLSGSAMNFQILRFDKKVFKRRVFPSNQTHSYWHKKVLRVLDCIHQNCLTVQHAAYRVIGTASFTTESINTIGITFSLMIWLRGSLHQPHKHISLAIIMINQCQRTSGNDSKYSTNYVDSSVGSI